MPRIPRVMLAGWPFHVTHRGNQKRRIFFNDSQRREYLRILRHYAAEFGMAVWGYCLMDNHVHVIVVGCNMQSIPRAMGNAHRAFSRRRNLEHCVTGHLWANRYYSSALDEAHLWAAIRYVELNPVRAGLVRSAADYRWSSARAHIGSHPDPLLHAARPFPGRVTDWSDWLAGGLDVKTAARLRECTATGRPCGSTEFVEDIEQRVGRPLKARKRGRPASARAVTGSERGNGCPGSR